MAQEFLALHIPLDAHHDEIDAALEKAFGAAPASFSMNSLTYNFYDLERKGNIVRHVETGIQMTVEQLSELLQEHCAFLRKSSVRYSAGEQDDEPDDLAEGTY